MAILPSHVSVQSEAFASNRTAMLSMLAELREAEERIRGHSSKAARKFESKGKLLPRDRISLLLDRGRPFIALSTLAGFAMDDDDGHESVTGGGLITGIGFVSGVRCVVVAHDSAIKGGAMTPAGLDKALRAQTIALENKLPIVTLAESAGANLLYQSRIFVNGGRTFANQAHLSAAGIPQVTVVHGSSTAGGAYLPGLSDYVVMVRGAAKVFLAGPPLLKAATGEIADDEELGGAEMHSTISGTAEYLAEDDADGVRLARDIMAMVARRWGSLSFSESEVEIREPKYDIDELLGLVPIDYRVPYDVREVIARIVDGSDFLDFKARYGEATVCGHAELSGHAIGIVSNNGPIDPDGATKAAQFIQLCCQSGRPIIYLQNTTGYMVGREAEESGIVKHGSKMIQAVANATVPQLTILMGASFGAGNFGMCGRAYDPRFLFAWPNSRIAVMGGEQAARVMRIISEDKHKRIGKEADSAALDAMEKEIIDQFDRESTPFYATARLWDDGIIDPRDTRRLLAFLLATCAESEVRKTRPTTFGVARL
jgi:geranyl-CoA carboxylase beta subunit